MASGTRGKLKENLEGIHRNCDWINQHCIKSLILIGDRNPKLTDAFTALGKFARELDKSAQAIYSLI